jgi:Protein of unknown function, DUF547
MKLVVFLLAAPMAAATGFDHTAWDRLLKQHVNAIGEVDYAAIKANRQPLDAYVAGLAAASPDSRQELFPDRASQLAYWLNAYNALTIRGVVDAYPTGGVRELGARFGFFSRKDYTLGGRKLSLQDLENGIIRARYRDPRIHFTIVCASVSCPRLDRDAFSASNLEQHLDRLTRRALAENRNVAIDAGRKSVTLTQLFKWYAADFGPALDFVRRYASPERQALLTRLGAKPRIGYFDYDWSINTPGSRAKAKLTFERELARTGAGKPN